MLLAQVQLVGGDSQVHAEGYLLLDTVLNHDIMMHNGRVYIWDEERNTTTGSYTFVETPQPYIITEW